MSWKQVTDGDGVRAKGRIRESFSGIRLQFEFSGANELAFRGNAPAIFLAQPAGLGRKSNEKIEGQRPGSLPSPAALANDLVFALNPTRKYEVCSLRFRGKAPAIFLAQPAGLGRLSNEK